MRFAFAALTIVMLPACTHAQGEAARPAEQAVAQVMIEALAPSSYGDWAYRWDAVSVRVSRHMHWHISKPDARDRPPDAAARRNGWIEAPGKQIGVSAFGGDEAVTSLNFETDAFHTLELVDALRQAGVEVRFQGDDESSSEYVITPQGRDYGVMRSARVCTSPESGAAERCHHEIELTFDPF